MSWTLQIFRICFARVTPWEEIHTLYKRILIHCYNIRARFPISKPSFSLANVHIKLYNFPHTHTQARAPPFFGLVPRPVIFVAPSSFSTPGLAATVINTPSAAAAATEIRIRCSRDHPPRAQPRGPLSDQGQAFARHYPSAYA